MVVTALSFPPNPSKAPDWGLLGGKWLAWAMSQQSAFPLTELSLTAFLKRGKPSSSQVHGAGQVGNPLPFIPQQSLSLPSLEPAVTSPAPSSPALTPHLPPLPLTLTPHLPPPPHHHPSCCSSASRVLQMLFPLFGALFQIDQSLRPLSPPFLWVFALPSKAFQTAQFKPPPSLQPAPCRPSVSLPAPWASGSSSQPSPSGGQAFCRCVLCPHRQRGRPWVRVVSFPFLIWKGREKTGLGQGTGPGRKFATHHVGERVGARLVCSHQECYVAVKKSHGCLPPGDHSYVLVLKSL